MSPKFNELLRMSLASIVAALMVGFFSMIYGELFDAWDLESSPPVVACKNVLRACGFGVRAERFALFLCADNIFTHHLLLFPFAFVMGMEIVGVIGRRQFSEPGPENLWKEGRTVLAHVGIVSVLCQSGMICAYLPDIFIGEPRQWDIGITGRYFLPSEYVEPIGDYHYVLQFIAPLSVLVAISCLIACFYALTKSLLCRLVGAFVAVLIVPHVASCGLSISQVLPDDVVLVAWAALVVWYVFVGLFVYIICRGRFPIPRPNDRPHFASID